MADRKQPNEPSLFDLPLRGKTSAAEGVAAESPASGESQPQESQTTEPLPNPKEEPAFWEIGDDGGADNGGADEERSSESADSASKTAASGPPASLFEGDGGDWADQPAARTGTSSGPDRESALAQGTGPGQEDGPGRSAAPGQLTASGETDAPDGRDAETAAPHRREPEPATWSQRLAANLLDGGLLLVVTAGVILGSFFLGVDWDSGELPALGMFLLVFSFVYSVMPLAFWGRTPGMALARVLSRGADGGPLTFGQTALRWLGGLLTLALAGLPLLLALPALGGRSLADRLSGSATWSTPDA